MHIGHHIMMSQYPVNYPPMAAFIHLWRHLFASETLFLAYIKFHHATSYVVLANQKRENWKHLITNNHILQKGLLHCCLGGEIRLLLKVVAI